ncbi:uncharacterized protein ARMOST_18279 [Armillaria ostoyae]|uniref:Uncharacterized protein n=1 Tax=Armillaria ostoyae TaxID=47428 RepID=A0A284S1C4_ARMOS|nr:uncharacterized protein ARMOST_18279 [Armillaria ostoyae]
MPPAGIGRSNARNSPYLGYVVSASPGSLSHLITSSPCLSFLLGLYVPAWSQPEPLSLSLNHQSNVFRTFNKLVYSSSKDSISGNSTQQTADTGNARSHEGSPAPPDAPQAQVTIRCKAIVETYRTGVNPSKPDVLAKII